MSKKFVCHHGLAIGIRTGLVTRSQIPSYIINDALLTRKIKRGRKRTDGTAWSRDTEETTAPAQQRVITVQVNEQAPVVLREPLRVLEVE